MLCDGSPSRPPQGPGSCPATHLSRGHARATSVSRLPTFHQVCFPASHYLSTSWAAWRSYQDIVPCELQLRVFFPDNSALSQEPPHGGGAHRWERELVREAFLSVQLAAVPGLSSHLFPRLSLAMDPCMCLPVKHAQKEMCLSSLARLKNKIFLHF